jgi:dGTPase
VSRTDVPAAVREVLGDTNGKIVYRLVDDLIEQSRDGSAIRFSPRVAEALGILKRFNYERIYLNPLVKADHHKVARIFSVLFEELLSDLKKGRRDSPVVAFVEDRDASYRDRISAEEIIRDYIAGMTDEYFLHVFKTIYFPSRLPRKF